MKINFWKMGFEFGKKKIILGYGGAIFIALLFISNAYAAPVMQINQTYNTKTTDIFKTKKEVTVDSNICITKEKLPLLKIAIQHIDDPDYKIFVDELIKIIEKNGKATSDDLTHIVYRCHLNIDRIAAGLVQAAGYDDTRNHLFWFPGIVRLRHILCGLIFGGRYGDVGPILIGTWNLYDGQHYRASYKINLGEVKTAPNQGMVLIGWSGLFFGFNTGININGGLTYTWWDAGGFYSLILVTET
jgi:hypothetical protein